MNTHPTKRILKLIGVGVLAVIPFAILLLPKPSPIWLTSVFTVSYVGWLIKLLYDNFDWCYFYANKALLYLSNGEVRWSMSVEISVAESSATASKSAFSAVLAAWPTAKVWRDDPVDSQISLPEGGGILRIRQTTSEFCPDPTVSCVVIDMSDLVVPFRSGKRVLESLISLFETLQKTLHPTEEKYTVRIKFGDKNPYFGLFLRRLRVPHEHLVHFTCDIDQRVGTETGRVAVGMERISLSTTSLVTLQTLSSRYITLASLDLASP